MGTLTVSGSTFTSNVCDTSEEEIGRLITALREIIRRPNVGGLGRVSSWRNLVLTYSGRARLA